jgi:hypothetical protein
MAEVERLLRLPEALRKPEYTAAAQAIQARLAGQLGRIRVSKEVDGRCLLSDQWVRPGEHLIDGGGGQARVVRVREGGTVEVKFCQGAVPP